MSIITYWIYNIRDSRVVLFPRVFQVIERTNAPSVSSSRQKERERVTSSIHPNTATRFLLVRQRHRFARPNRDGRRRLGRDHRAVVRRAHVREPGDGRVRLGGSGRHFSVSHRNRLCLFRSLHARVTGRTPTCHVCVCVCVDERRTTVNGGSCTTSGRRSSTTTTLTRRRRCGASR